MFCSMFEIKINENLQKKNIWVNRKSPAGIYLLKFNSRRSSIFIVNFEHISHLVLVFL